MPLTLETLTDAVYGDLHPHARTLQPAEQHRAALSEHLTWHATDALSDDFARGYAASAAVPGTTPDDYRNRWVPVSPDLQVLCGPRFEGMDLARPFVEVVGGSRPLELADLPHVTDAVRRAFRMFQPRYARLYRPEPDGAVPGAHPDRRFVGATLGTLRAAPLPDGLRAAPPQNFDFRPAYEAAYRASADADPHHPTYAQPETLDALQDYLNDGLLFEVRLHGRWVGLIAALPTTHLGLSGLEVAELTLAQDARGQGLGAALTTLLARAVPHPDTDVLLGTVHARNTPALKAALRAGRTDLGGWVQLPL
ncbi:GNAT family N-acetyltransferase [Deinococcus maricopensis]|uniref:GCN5-related N-acetyltransferase n=1 Tax=Deinococcus maricopensis (strain DSM 21211 / LMG 22137 / NRRL B-23946 / LB-34) TaxID=709986 RepID=E8U8J0_DEIML|nr:GNAT family N-acetyltransferase [Deinococcus maricopensis]ADV67379.1 GCN5-related N-acetyltransferase [Deinococcus maricopensis DSM 21211]